MKKILLTAAFLFSTILPAYAEVFVWKDPVYDIKVTFPDNWVRQGNFDDDLRLSILAPATRRVSGARFKLRSNPTRGLGSQNQDWKPTTMRFMSIVKADKNYENGAPPDPKLMASIGKLSEDLIKSGIMLDMGGLLPSAAGARLYAKGGKVTVKDGVLSLEGERQQEKEEKNKKFHRVERSYGKFVRCFTMPEDASPQGVRADFKDGMLNVHLVKSVAAKPKGIEVTVN